MEIKAILFDLDDTLFDYEYAHQRALKKVFSELQKIVWMKKELLEIVFEMAQQDVKRQLIGLSASHNRDLYFQKVFEKINLQNQKKIKPKQIIILFKAYREVFYKNVKIEKSSINLLKYLKTKGLKTWIVTDSQLYSQLKKIEILDISEYVDVLVSSEEAWAEKPQSSPFLLATHRLRVLAENCVMVWDNISRDIDWARALGMKGIWINRHNKD